MCAHFPRVSRDHWLARFQRGRVLDANGIALTVEHQHQTGMTVRYFREVDAEPLIPFDAQIIHADEDLVVVDKPHFLPVMPAGRFVKQTLLRRLMNELGNTDLVPLHRIDRATAGLVMFSARPESRDSYQSLFRQRAVEKHYEALAPALSGVTFPLTRQSRIVHGDPFFCMREVDGPANSESLIDIIDRSQRFWKYALSPITGRKHQLRVHMAALGAGILNDRIYPELRPEIDDDFDKPLGLLARSLSFSDPISGRPRHFESRLTL